MKERAASHCPDCGVPLPEYWPKGLCVNCALDGAFEVNDAAGNNNAGPSSPRLFGGYELVEEIARGGMGVIYRARQLKLNRTVALKMILAGQFASKEEVARFRSEAEAAATLQHPNIVRIHETGEHDGHRYFSMDYVQGRTLAEIVRDGPLPAQRAAKYSCRIAEAIHYAHTQGVLHRDLKPSNVIIDAQDEPQITDFGLAKRMREDFGVTVTGQVLGSPNFMPPEQTSTQSGRANPASDVYGIGAILYCLLTGRPPFHAETIEELLLLLRDTDPVSPRLLNPSVPRDLETICLKCLEKDPVKRYATAQALADELGRFLRNEPIEARPLRTPAKIWRWCGRRPAIAALSTSVLLLLVFVAFSSTIAVWRVNRARTSEQKANRDLRRSVSLLELERAEDYFNAHDAAFGVAHLTAILRRDPSNSVAAHRLVSALTQRRWATPAGGPLRHMERLTTAFFSPSEQRILTVERGKSVYVWDVQSREPVVHIEHAQLISSADYSPDGKRILTASADGLVRISDSETGAELVSMPHSNKLYWAEFSCDGALVVTACADRLARIWDTRTGRLKHSLRGHSSHVVQTHFTPDSQRVITIGSHGSVRIWDALTAKTILRVEDRGRPLTAAALSPNGQRLAVACDDDLVKVWDTMSGRAIGPPLVHNREVWHVTFSADSRLLMTTCEDGAARLWNAETLQLLGGPLRHDSGVLFSHFSPDGKSVVTTSTDSTARVWDTATGMPLCQPLRHVSRVVHADFSADGRRLVTASFDGMAQVWDLRPSLDPSDIEHGWNAMPFAVTADGAAVLTAAHDKSARLWEAKTGRPLSEPAPQETYAIRGTIAPDGRHVALVYLNHTTRVWDWGDWKGLSGTLTRPQSVAGPLPHGRRVHTVCFSRDSLHILTASADKTARVWNATNGRPALPTLVHAAEVVAAQFSPDSRKIVTASHDRTAQIWDAVTGRVLAPPLTHADHVKWAEFSPDGTRVVTASTDNTACIWDAETGQKLITLQHARIVERAVFSPDGTRVATASLDCTAEIWDAQTGQALTPPLRHERGAARVQFTADARRLFTTMWSGPARIWDTETGRPLTEWLGIENPRGEEFDPVAGRLFIGSTNGVLKAWNIREAPMPVPDWFLKFCESIAGIRMGNMGTVELAAREKVIPVALEKISTPPREQKGFYEDLASKLLAPPLWRE